MQTAMRRVGAPFEHLGRDRLSRESLVLATKHAGTFPGRHVVLLRWVGCRPNGSRLRIYFALACSIVMGTRVARRSRNDASESIPARRNMFSVFCSPAPTVCAA